MLKMRAFHLAAIALVALVGVSTAVAARDAKTSARHKASVVISTRKVGKLGTVLVNAKGRTLYMFVPDKRKRVTCVKTCAVIWPPVKVPAKAKVVAKGKAKSKLFGIDKDPAGGRVVTYHGWPLYTYVSDTKPGMATGQALKLNGGLWYVVAPSGKVIKTKLVT